MRNTLIVGDLHVPAVHPMYLQFLVDVADAYECLDVVFIGDLADAHTVSNHPKSTEALMGSAELDRIRNTLEPFHRTFRKATVTLGNHDRRWARAASQAGMPAEMVVPLQTAYALPKTWTLLGSWEGGEGVHWIKGVAVTHGTPYGGKHPERQAADLMGASTIIGHCHSAGGVSWIKMPTGRRFGMSVSCGCDPTHPLMAYGSAYKTKTLLGCGILKGGVPHYIPMLAEHADDPYHRSNVAAPGKYRPAYLQ